MATKNNGEEKNGNGKMVSGMSCMNCGRYCGGACCGYDQWPHYVLRWVLGIAIILLAFWLGMRVGEFKGEVWGWGGGSRFYHGGMMRGYGNFGPAYGPGDNYWNMPMMSGGWSNGPFDRPVAVPVPKIPTNVAP